MDTLSFEAITALAFGHLVGATADGLSVPGVVVLELEEVVDEGELADEL